VVVEQSFSGNDLSEWIVERTLAWISHNRRLARDFERYARTAAAFARRAMIRIMLRRLTRTTHST
jgi:putative transposase